MKGAVGRAMRGKRMVGAIYIIIDRSVEKHAEFVVSIMPTPLHMYIHICIYIANCENLSFILDLIYRKNKQVSIVSIFAVLYKLSSL